MNNQTTTQPTPEQIAVCAYLIWEKQGRPHGRHETHWFQAERQLKADMIHEAGLAAPPVIAPPRLKRGKKSKPQEVAIA